MKILKTFSLVKKTSLFKLRFQGARSIKMLALLLALTLCLSSCDAIKELFNPEIKTAQIESSEPSAPFDIRFAKDFAKLKDKPGTQIGLIIDPHEYGNAFFQIHTFYKKPSVSAYEILEDAYIEKIYDPKYTLPQVFIQSLNGISNQKIDGKAHSWAFFYRENNQWKLSPKGVGSAKFKDGDIIGFSFSSWEEVNGEYKPLREPQELAKIE